MIVNKKFENYIKRFNFKITKVHNRNDILSVKYRGHHLFTIPKKMYGFPNPNHRDLYGRQHPFYFELENRSKQYNILVKRSPEIQKLEALIAEQDNEY